MAAVDIDRTKLPPSAMLDSSVLIPALGSKTRRTDDPLCRPLFEAMVTARRPVLIAAPSAAEFFRRSPTTAIPRTATVRVVPFDLQAAEILGTKFPPDVLKTWADATKRPLHYVKYDALIVACAVRHRAAVLVTTDGAQKTLAASVGLEVRSPTDYGSAQLRLPDP